MRYSGVSVKWCEAQKPIFFSNLEGWDLLWFLYICLLPRVFFSIFAGQWTDHVTLCVTSNVEKSATMTLLGHTCKTTSWETKALSRLLEVSPNWAASILSFSHVFWLNAFLGVMATQLQEMSSLAQSLFSNSKFQVLFVSFFSPWSLDDYAVSLSRLVVGGPVGHRHEGCKLQPLGDTFVWSWH